MGGQWEKMSDWEGHPKCLDFLLIPLVNFINGGWGGVKWEKKPNNPNRNREETPTVEVRALLAERNSPDVCNLRLFEAP